MAVTPHRPQWERLGRPVAADTGSTIIQAANTWAGPGRPSVTVVEDFLQAVEDGEASLPEPPKEQWETAPFLSACWCERTYVEVTPEDVRAGLTGSCGTRRCHA